VEREQKTELVLPLSWLEKLKNRVARFDLEVKHLSSFIWLQIESPVLVSPCTKLLLEIHDMPKKIIIPHAFMHWLREHHSEHTHKQLADRAGCCVDTMKRLLHREGLQTFEGAKYVAINENPQKMWDRACIRCKCTKPRPKNQFICTPCWGREYEDV
jgi:hypothetical protein